jgi:hypothetical protein
MKNLDDPAQFTDREKAIIDKDTARKLCKCGDLKGKVSLTIPRLRITYYFKSREDMETKRSRYELYKGEGKVK